MNHTAFGFIAVLIWGFSLPIGRVIQEQIGAVAYLGILFLVIGLLSLAKQNFKLSFSAKERSHPVFYLRWAFFVFHEAFISIAIGIVSLKNIPIIILINYLWPTAIIIASILIAGVRVYRIVPFLLGTAIVISSLAYELLGDTEHSNNVFSNATDNVAYALTFIGAISWGLYCALSKKYGAVTGEARTIPLFQLTLGMALPLMFLPTFSHEWRLDALGATLLCSICLAQTFAYYAWDKGMRLGNIVILSLLADFIPWLSLLASTLILDIKIEKRTIFSALFLVVGALLTRFATKAPTTTSTTTKLA